MKFGFCGRFSDAASLAVLGGQYLEPGVSSELRPLDSDEAYYQGLRQTLNESGIAAEVFNLMVPGHLRITGPSRDGAALSRYMTEASRRAAGVGGKVLVFGSAGARNVEPGESYEKAWGDIRRFLVDSADIVADAGLVIAIESLASNHCTTLTSVAEVVRMAQDVGRPDAVGVLSDLYHVNCDYQSFDETAAAGKWLRHVHIACGSDRHAPTDDDYDELVSFFGALRRAGYNDRVSVEADITDFDAAVSTAMPVMRRAWAAA